LDLVFPERLMRGLSKQIFHELPRAEDSGIGCDRLSISTKPLDCLPSAKTSDQPSALEIVSPPLPDTRSNKLAIGNPGAALIVSELAENVASGLPRSRYPAQQCYVPAPWKLVELLHIGHEACTQWVEMEVPHQLQKIRFFVHHYGPVPILKEVAHPLMPPVEGTGVASKQGPHASGEGATPGPHQHVGVIRQQRPSIDGQESRMDELRYSGKEVDPVHIIPEDGPSLNSAHHDMVDRARGI
jgi:hypothetical protein